MKKIIYGDQKFKSGLKPKNRKITEPKIIINSKRISLPLALEMNLINIYARLLVDINYIVLILYELCS